MRTSILAGMTLMLIATTASAPARLHIGAPDSANRQCISLHAIRDESAEDDGHLIFHVGGSRAYRNYLPRPCDGLRSINDLGKLKLQPQDPGQLCRGDKIELKGTDSALGVLDVGTSGTGRVSCTLGDFEPINEMSLTEQLRR
jgi:hypothetical protein